MTEGRSLRGVVGTTALVGAGHGACMTERWHEIWGHDTWTGMPPSSGEPQRMRRVMRASGMAPLLTEHLRLAAQKLSHIDYATDLGSDIGSARWWRGLGLMLALAGYAVGFWPGFAPPMAPLHQRAAALGTDSPAHEILATGAAMDADAPSAPTPRHSAAPGPQVSLVTTLADGDSYGAMLQRVGVGVSDAEQVSALIAAAIPVGEIAPGTSFHLSADALGNHALQSVEFKTRTDLVVAITRRGASFELGTRASIGQAAPINMGQPVALAPLVPAPLPAARTFSGPATAPVAPMAEAAPLRIRGVVGASLYRSARAAGVPGHAVQEYLHTLGAHMDIGDLRADDTFDIILSRAHSGHAADQGGTLLYAGLERKGHRRAALVRWGGGGKGGQFFDAAAAPGIQAPAHLLMPVIGKITSGFGMRFHPILGFTRMHEGVDLSAPFGAPIYAVASGEVAYAGPHGGHGKYVRLEHSGGLGTGYAHMSRIAVASGTHVRAGQVIGYVGSSGLSTGAHLHYEVYRGGQTVNPMTVRFGAPVRMAAPRNLGAIRARLATLMLVRPGVAARGGTI